VLPKDEEGAARQPLELDVLLTASMSDKEAGGRRPVKETFSAGEQDCTRTLLVRPPIATTICSHSFMGGANGLGSLPRMYSKSMWKRWPCQPASPSLLNEQLPRHRLTVARGHGLHTYALHTTQALAREPLCTCVVSIKLSKCLSPIPNRYDTTQ
jgi:hypothetical protein